MKKTHALIRTPIVLLCLAALVGCSNLDTTEQRVLSGGAAGAAIGAVGTVVTGGCVACGTVIGGAVGAGAGYVVDQVEKSKKKK